MSVQRSTLKNMGDPARHRVFADFIAKRWPDRSLRIADVAGGHGQLNAELHRRGYRQVVTFDRRRGRWTERPHYRYGEFNSGDADGFDLLVGMHPDAATDVVLAASLEQGMPAAVVPCCAVPTAWPYAGRWGTEWVEHLQARSGALRACLPISGASTVLLRP